MNIRFFYSKPMSSGDSTLMMLLSLNLLLLVFFMLLNSMATYGAKHAKDVLADVREGYDVPPRKGRDDGNVVIPEMPLAMWRAGMVVQMQGLVANRLDLRVLPQQGQATQVELSMPFAALFGDDGRLEKPELVKNILALAGADSDVRWQVRGRWEEGARLAVVLANLSRSVGHAEAVRGEESVVVIIKPKYAVAPERGLQLQRAAEQAGGQVQGVEEKASPRE